MKQITLTFLVLSLSVFGRSHQERPQKPQEGKRGQAPAQETAVPLELQMSSELNVFPESTLDTVANVFQMSMALTQAVPPSGDHLFKWEGDKSPLAKKQVKIVMTTSDDPRLKKLTMAGGINETNDAVSVVGIDKQGNIEITTLLLADRLFYKEVDGKLEERTDGMVRVATALAHEVYGNVTSMLKMKVDRNMTQTLEQRRAQERVAFQAGIEFLKRIQKDARLQSLPDKIKKDVAEAIEREEVWLASWEEGSQYRK